jgi:hypothetical protein
MASPNDCLLRNRSGATDSNRAVAATGTSQDKEADDHELSSLNATPHLTAAVVRYPRDPVLRRKSVRRRHGEFRRRRDRQLPWWGGALSQTVRPLRDILLCHRSMCRRTHGHIGAYTAVPKTALRLTESRGLKWYRSSDKARRGFCSEFGASLFWEPVAQDYVAIAAGTLDAPTGLKTSLQIHVASADDYYAIDTAIPQRAA